MILRVGKRQSIGFKTMFRSNLAAEILRTKTAICATFHNRRKGNDTIPPRSLMSYRPRKYREFVV